MKKITFTFSLLTLLTLFVSCDYFSTSTHTPQQIKKASQWSEKDQAPNFEECQGLAQAEQFSCFKDSIASVVDTALSAQEFKANQEIDEVIVLVLLIDENGLISLSELENDSYVSDAIPELIGVLEEAVNSLPTAIPATKTNVGVVVRSQLKLPIRVVATVQ